MMLLPYPAGKENRGRIEVEKQKEAERTGKSSVLRF